MNCEQWLSLINASMDGELLLDDGHRLTAHLGECATCRVAADELERDDRELARNFGPRQRAASTIADQVLDAWFEEAPSPSRLRVYLRWASSAAAGFAVAFFLFGPGTRIGSNGEYEYERVRTLVEEWKQSDSPYEVELHLRSLGPACASPLARVVRTWDGEENDELRIEAARVLCDLADASQIPTLIDLLGDKSPKIRTLTEASLVRLTGRRQVELPGPTLAQAASCSNPQAEWRDWWNNNKERFERPDG